MGDFINFFYRFHFRNFLHATDDFSMATSCSCHDDEVFGKELILDHLFDLTDIMKKM